MFKNVIVGIDGKSGGRDAAALARRLVGPQGLLTLVHVHLETTAVIVHEFNSAAREEAQKLLEDEREAAGGEAELAHVGGTSVAVGLHRYAEKHGADLLVVGAGRRGVVGRVLAGDDARDTLQGAPCAVAVSPHGYVESSAPIEIVGVGYEGSAKSQAALATASELAADFDAEVHALILVPVVRFDALKPPRMHSVMGTDPRLSDMRRQLDDLDRVTARPAYGVPVEELGTFEKEVDLLLLGSRSEGPERRLAVERISKHLARSARCPLLIVPSSRRDTQRHIDVVSHEHGAAA
jgi:nucleotide-binding universal stress UspA family protein